MSRFGQMIDMASTPAEVKEKAAESCAPILCDAPRYPYGLCISLDNETMDKLGLSGDLPEVGEMIHLCAMAKVTSVSANERESTGDDGATKKETYCRVELQITTMALESEDDENQMMRRSRFYGGTMGNKDAV